MLLRIAQHATIHPVIRSIKHKGLRRFFEKGVASGVQSNHVKKRRMQLAALESSKTIDDMDIPGFRLHPLKGTRENYWAIDVSGNWRLTFRFEDGDIFDLNYEDYH